MKLNMIPNFKNFFQAETVNAEENKAYYQRYDTKIMRSPHNQATTKQQIYENILAMKIRMDFSPGICFEKILVNMDKVQAFTTKH